MTIKKISSFDSTIIFPLYDAVGWKNYTENPVMTIKAWKKSLLSLGAYDGDRLVGIVRAVGDGASIVFIQDLIVLPDYQRRGIGTTLLRKVAESFPDVYQLQLMTDNTPKTVAFYKSLGFTEADDCGCCAFIKFNK